MTLPMLASDFVEAKLRFPLIWQPKIDGVRGLNLDGQLTGRSLKTHANKFTTAFFSQKPFRGLDGELAAQAETHPDLCRLTTSAVNSIEGEPFTLWHCFDFINEETIKRPYSERLAMLARHVEMMRSMVPTLGNRVRVIPWVLCTDREQLTRLDDQAVEKGYEGSILRRPDGFYKEGRSTPTEGGLLRIKQFSEGEMRVVRVEEGETNLNEAKINETGHTERSTHQANMVPNGMVGRLIGIDLKTDKEMVCAPGRMTHDERRAYLQFPQRIVGQVVKFKHFKKGVKDKNRFPTYQCVRASSDIGVE